MDDEAFVETARNDVRRLVERAGLTQRSRLLDWGCGAGRLAIGVRHEIGEIRDYHGVDVQRPLIDWAQTHLATDWMRFTLVDVANPRYNPNGTASRLIPAEEGSVDVFYAYSVLSHMLADDVVGYARVISKILAPGGLAVVTAFVEDDVESWVENPRDYGPLEWTGALHCVRYNRQFFETLLHECGLEVESFEHGGETDGQSLYVLGHTAGSSPALRRR